MVSPDGFPISRLKAASKGCSFPAGKNGVRARRRHHRRCVLVGVGVAVRGRIGAGR
jgi:hypothetical protein